MIQKMFKKGERAIRASVKPIILLVFVVLVIYLGKMFDISQYLNKEFIQNYVSSFGIYAPLIFGLIYVIGTVLFFPGTPLTISSGFLFGPWYGTLITVFFATIGASLAFLLSRFLGKDFVDRVLKNKFKKLSSYDSKLENSGFVTTLFLRLVPLFPFSGLNFALGLTRVKLKDFFFATLLGTIPGTFVLANIGHSANDLRSPKFYLFILLFIGLMFIPYLYKKYKSKN